MKRKTLKLFAALAVLSAVSAVSFSAPAAPDETLKALTGYRQWASVKGEPGRVTLAVSSVSIDPGDIAIWMMAPVARRVGDVPQVRTSQGTTKISLEGSWVFEPQPPSRKGKKPEWEGSHAGESKEFNVVYFNETASAAFIGGRPAKFPVGSIIISEKLSKHDDAPPERIAVMVKRAAGFNPKSGDWEFLIVNGALDRIHERQKKGRCAECHASQRENDFVFPSTPPSKSELRNSPQKSP